jgi:hypothetical protein
MTTSDRAARNSQIVEARLRGLGEITVANRFAVTPRQVRRVLAEHRKSRPRLDDIDPLEVVRDALDGYEALAEELALLAERTSHDGVRLGAIRGRLDVQKARLDLLQAAGLLPADLPQLRVLRDMERTADVIMQVFDQEGVPERAQRRIADVLSGREEGPQVLPLPSSNGTGSSAS